MNPVEDNLYSRRKFIVASGLASAGTIGFGFHPSSLFGEPDHDFDKISLDPTILQFEAEEAAKAYNAVKVRGFVKAEDIRRTSANLRLL